MNLIELLVSFAIIGIAIGVAARFLGIPDWLGFLLGITMCTGLWLFLRRRGGDGGSREKDDSDDAPST